MVQWEWIKGLTGCYESWSFGELGGWGVKRGCLWRRQLLAICSCDLLTVSCRCYFSCSCWCCCCISQLAENLWPAATWWMILIIIFCYCFPCLAIGNGVFIVFPKCCIPYVKRVLQVQHYKNTGILYRIILSLGYFSFDMPKWNVLSEFYIFFFYFFFFFG